MVDEKEDHDPKEHAHEQEPQLATVKMLLQSIGQTVTVAFPLRSPLNELLNHFAKELRMPPSILQVTFKGNFWWTMIDVFMRLAIRLEKVLDTQLTLSQIDVEPNTTVSMGQFSFTPFERSVWLSTVSLELHSKDPANEPLRPYRPRQDISMPDVITVRIDEGLSAISPSRSNWSELFFSNRAKYVARRRCGNRTKQRS